MSERYEVQFPGGKRVDVRVGDFVIHTDQSIKRGGEASAPEPFDLFLSSMAACAGIFALNFCTSRDLPTAGLGLSMDWEVDPTNPANASVRYLLRLPEGFPDKYRSSIIKAIDLCAVKKYVQNAPSFQIDIVD